MHQFKGVDFSALFIIIIIIILVGVLKMDL